MIVTAAQHRQALAIACPVCLAAVGLRCIGVTRITGGHAARWHALASLSKPEPDESCVRALTETPGRRADAQPFARWLDGRHDFRSPGSRTGSGLTLRVYRVGTAESVVDVRRALVDLAVRHGLLVLAAPGGRETYAVTPRGLAFAAALTAGTYPSTDNAHA